VNFHQKIIKRLFDLLFSLIGLLLLWWLIIFAWMIATLNTKSNGFFTQERVGKNGCLFNIIKIRSMLILDDLTTTVTIDDDIRITALGGIFRKLKIDELPQLINIFLGQMSFVGPRPDVPGYADLLGADDKIMLSVRPGITGPATIKYRNEEMLLAKQKDPESYNRNVIWPDKVRINKEYINNWSLSKDICYIFSTLFSGIRC
jgi:lipopolysaccharide/colanic/teichoic acid biosynthesis glycosyltransferase